MWRQTAWADILLNINNMQLLPQLWVDMNMCPPERCYMLDNVSRVDKYSGQRITGATIVLLY